MYEVDKNTVNCDHSKLKINNKVDCVCARLEKSKARKGNNYEPEYV